MQAQSECVRESGGMHLTEHIMGFTSKSGSITAAFLPASQMNDLTWCQYDPLFPLDAMCLPPFIHRD